MTAPSFEKNISEQESRRQLLSSLSGGLVIPSILVEKAFNKENQIKTIRFIDLEKYYLSKSPSQSEIKEIYENNKDMFTEEFKSFVYAEVNPQNLTGKSVYDENFYRNLDILENKLLDGQPFEEAAKDNNLKILNYKKINSNMQNKEKKQLKIYLISYLKNLQYQINKLSELIKIDDKYFLAEIKNIDQDQKSINDPKVLKTIKAQLQFKNKIE